MFDVGVYDTPEVLKKYTTVTTKECAPDRQIKPEKNVYLFLLRGVHVGNENRAAFRKRQYEYFKSTSRLNWVACLAAMSLVGGLYVGAP